MAKVNKKVLLALPVFLILISFSFFYLNKTLTASATKVRSNCVSVEVGSAGGTGLCPLEESEMIEPGKATECTGQTVNLGFEKRLLPIGSQCPGAKGCGRKTKCFTPTKIVMHTTWGNGDVTNLYNYFAGGSDGRGVGTQFGIGENGRVLQMMETLSDKMELGVGIANYNSQAISIELCHPSDYTGRSNVPQAQYSAALSLVRTLMRQYNIPLGSIEYAWKSGSNARNSSAGPGIYGHYQLNPETKSDPGSGFMRDFRDDLRLGT